MFLQTMFNKIPKKVYKFSFFAIILAFNIFFMAMLLISGLLPSKLLSLIVIWNIVLGVVVVTATLARYKWINITGYTIGTIVGVAMLLLGISLKMEWDKIVRITGADVNTHVINVIVLDSSPHEKIEDVIDLAFAANTKLEQKNMDKVKEQAQEKFKKDLNIEEYDNYANIIADLYSGKSSVILLSESNRPFVEIIDEEFEEKTRVIYTFTYDEKVSQPNKQGNTPKPNLQKETFSFFVSGIDTFGPLSTVSRSDVNMIVTVSPTTNQVLMTSIPRDYFVPLATSGELDKLTHAGNFGIQESVDTVANLFDIHIDYYIRVNFSSVTEIIDALGGVEVDSPHAFTSRYKGYYIQQGINQLDSDKALAFVRERYSLPNGDNDRVINQQILLTAIINKLQEPTWLKNYSSLLSSLEDMIQISMSSQEIAEIVKGQLESPAKWEILKTQVSGTGRKTTETYSLPGWNLYVMDPDYDTVKSAAELIHKMEDGQRISVD